MNGTNQCYLDCFSHIQLNYKDDVKIGRDDILHYKISDGKTLINRMQKPRNSIAKSVSRCWVCEGWTEHRIMFRFEEGKVVEPLFVHFDFDAYVPDLMERD